jgi:hypothetical protein
MRVEERTLVKKSKKTFVIASAARQSHRNETRTSRFGVIAALRSQ